MGRKRLTEDQVTQRFLERIEIDDNGCWIWQAHRSHGYGMFYVGGKTVSAHRWAFERWVDILPQSHDEVIGHSCHRGKAGCVNPDHLEIDGRVPNARNNGHARKTHCANGHEFTEENTAWYRARGPRADPSRLTRVCRTCYRIRNNNAKRARKMRVDAP